MNALASKIKIGFRAYCMEKTKLKIILFIIIIQQINIVWLIGHIIKISYWAIFIFLFFYPVI